MPLTQAEIQKTSLWSRLTDAPALGSTLLEIRELAGEIGKTVERVLPSFTDHSIRHMDSLWNVTDAVFLDTEIANFSAAEAFVLGSTFYVHDLGMAFGATKVGMERLQESAQFKSEYLRLRRASGIADAEASSLALEVAARELHARNATSLVLEPLPGLDRYLIENTDLRDKWAHFIGDVASSHHWPLGEVDRRLGIRGRLRAPSGGDIDLAYLACALRVVDFAHINFQRASVIERLLRSSMPASSAVHWAAQENIDGPLREDERLRYTTHKPIRDVEAWWLLFQLASGLNDEIVAVREYLQGRTCSAGRFSLQGVQRVTTPQDFATLVATDGFEPVDVRLRPHSIDRLIEVLGGRSLYGDNKTVAIREVIQNSRDAISLRRLEDEERGIPPSPGVISIKLLDREGVSYLTVSDNGVGMSQSVLTNYLLGIASDYWRSPEFFADFTAVAQRFKPVGRFGIGFLSVFMIGSAVAVETERRGGQRIRMELESAGRRGALRPLRANGVPGTSIEIRIKPNVLEELDAITEMSQAYAPMLEYDINVEVNDNSHRIGAGWWHQGSAEEFLASVDRLRLSSTPRRHLPDQEVAAYGHLLRKVGGDGPSGWTGRIPEVIMPTGRLLAAPNRAQILVCSQGILVTQCHMPGFSGAIEIGAVELNAARSQPLDWSEEDFKSRTLERLLPEIVTSVNALDAVNVPTLFEALERIADLYGTGSVTLTTLPWITVVEPPGSSALMSPGELKLRLARETSVMISIGKGPWTVWSHCRTRFPDAAPSSVVLPVPCKDYFVAAAYDRAPEVVYGPLGDHISEAYSTSHGREFVPTILRAILQLIAEAWGTSVKVLASQSWSRDARAGELAGRLVRPY